jgi:uncharacterized protein (TIRG00374 family)
MTPRVGKLLRIAFSVLVMALVLEFAGGKEIWRTMRGVRPGWIVTAFALAGLDRIVIGQRWRLLLGGRGVRIGFLQLTRLQLSAGFLGSFLPTSVGVDAIRIASLCRLGHPGPRVIAATLVDRMSLVIGTLILGAAMLLLCSHSILPERFVVVILGLAVIALGGVATVLHPTVRHWCRIVVLNRVPLRFRQRLDETVAAMIGYRHQHRLMTAVGLLTVMAFVVRIVFVAAIARAVSAHVDFLDLATVVPILWIIVMLPITIGALGVQDAAFVALLSLVGVPPPLAAAMSLIEHAIARLGNFPGVLFMSEAMGGRRADAQRGGSPDAASSPCL